MQAGARTWDFHGELLDLLGAGVAVQLHLQDDGRGWSGAMWRGRSISFFVGADAHDGDGRPHPVLEPRPENLRVGRALHRHEPGLDGHLHFLYPCTYAQSEHTCMGTARTYLYMNIIAIESRIRTSNFLDDFLHLLRAVLAVHDRGKDHGRHYYFLLSDAPSSIVACFRTCKLGSLY